MNVKEKREPPKIKGRRGFTSVKETRAFYKEKLKHSLVWRRLRTDFMLYIILTPTILYFLIFRLWPIMGMRLAFYEYKARSPWVFVGLKYFRMIFRTSAFMDILSNTLIISFMKFVLLFPFFVLFAIILNELRVAGFRKYVQVVSYMPHFLSWVVIAGIWIAALAPSTGSVNQILGIFNLPSIDFMTDKTKIRWILMLSEAWRSIGWDSIFYYTAILSIPPSLYEAAEIDGANRLSIIRYIILPALVTPMVTVFILNLGFFLNAGFDQVLNFSNDAVLSTTDILDTYIYRVGIQNAQYSLSTAVSLIKGVVGVFLVLTTHLISKKFTGKGVW
ncbi:ABC transporter permease [Alkaliphilus peptidifermentans]|uniref:Putative aldouronate transport system permease protein n=1 Tax=Alkaliphilus peptidifermentans DSM 18978 TaxID=1120976 RepID=A0A1G5FZJ7_9FIRM|nr:ABC transporter permease subunit [Alkaliphilus peptidifermentans]SCY44772.1 putative aldouronate transport system permease protein [Alkaliphilus peptidifermentans DSM 18978]